MTKNQLHPSIHQIVLEDHKNTAKKNLNLIFQNIVYPNFPIHEFDLSSYLAKDTRYYQLVTELKHWNRNNNQPFHKYNLRAQFTRNQFIYTSLKSIIAHGSKGNQNFQKNLQKLYQWYKNNCQQHNQFHFTARKRKTIIEDDWKVRKTFKSNMPLEINTYERRVICMQPPFDEQIHSPQNVTLFQLQQFKIRQNKIKEERQKEQISIVCNIFKKSKQRLVQKIQQNYFFGNFNNKQKLFSRHDQNSASQKTFKMELEEETDSQIFPNFQKAETALGNIKKYRINSSLGYKNSQRRSHDPYMRRKQKANTTFSTKTQNNTMEQDYKIEDQLNKTCLRIQKASTFLSSIDGGSLMKNPFQNKKLKKVGNKRR